MKTCFAYLNLSVEKIWKFKFREDFQVIHSRVNNVNTNNELSQLSTAKTLCNTNNMKTLWVITAARFASIVS